MLTLDPQIDGRLASIGERHPSRAPLAEKFLHLTLNHGYSAHEAGNGYIGINVLAASECVRVFHITNAGRLTILYYMLKGPASKHRAHMKFVLKEAGLPLKRDDLDNPNAQETIDLPDQSQTWSALGGGLDKLRVLLSSES